LGHIRNNLLGWSVSEILKAAGKQVVRVNLVNDRGIHICKSMLAWQKWGEERTPSAELKGDKLVGEMYVRFDQEYKKEIATLVAGGMAADEAGKKAPLMLQAQQMLRDWEADEPAVKALWAKMNGWVYDGFDITYGRLGVAFEKIYHESETFLLGKKLVLEGLEKGVFYRKEDGSVWCDLTDQGLDEKLLMRADGTSVYMTQDLGTAQLRADEFKPQRLIYVVGNEQNYHFDVLKLVLKKLGREWADYIEHLSYGMVELPAGKMKSREGTVVDADDLMDEMVNTAKVTSEELGKTDGLSAEDANQLYNMVGLGALKYFMLRVDPKKTMLFNPAESIDFNGNTGPFIQYTHARIRSVLRKAVELDLKWQKEEVKIDKLLPKEKNLIVIIHAWPEVLQQAAEGRSPALVANYLYELAKEFNQFYQEFSILKEEDQQRKLFRLQLSQSTADLLRNAASLLGMGMPEKM
jgi:arginyl-tRNA synthetase